MAVADTSKEAYGRIQFNLSGRQEQVYEALEKLGRASNQQVAEHLNLPINQVTGRVSELVKKQAVEQAGSRLGKYRQREKLWQVKKLKTDTPEQLTLDCA